MKKDIHPKYQKVLFVDTATGSKFVCGTTLQPEGEKEVFEGQEYPTYRVAISSTSHPLYTGSSGLVDSEGRVDKFRKRYQKAPAQAAAAAEAPADAEKPAKDKAPAKKAKAKK
jgi:large subunit ribosomal protein L31